MRPFRSRSLSLAVVLTLSITLSLQRRRIVTTAFLQPVQNKPISTPSCSSSSSSSVLYLDRRGFGESVLGGAGMMLLPWSSSPRAADAQVFFDPAQYGDQELRVSAVDSVKESVRRAILKTPALAPSFYQLSLLDGLSYDASTERFGPDGSVMKVLFSTKAADEYTENLQKAGAVLIETEQTLRRKTAISLPDAIAIGGAEAIESIGGPILPVQLGRADTPKKGPVNDNVPLDILSGNRPNSEVAAVFRSAGLTEREMTALLSGLLTLERVEKTRTSEEWRASAKPKFREPGKLGRVSEFKPITDEDIAQAELEEDPEYEDPDDGWYISDSFGTKEERFGQRIGAEDISEKTFNKYIVALNDAVRQKAGKSKKKEGGENVDDYGWVANLLLDDNVAQTSQTWINKYASSNLNYLKDLSVAFNAVTQLGAVYTGGKYENLLKNRPRKSLNDDDLNLGF